MKRFFVLFCKQNMSKPHVYLSLSTVKDKIKNNPQLTFEQFKTELEAEKFIYPKKINYLVLEEQMSKKGVDIKDMKKLEEEVLDLDENITSKQLVVQSKDQMPQAPQKKQEDPQKSSSQLIDFEQISLSMKSAAQKQINKQNLKRTYQQILDLCGDQNYFIKSQHGIPLKSTNQYYAFFDGCSKNNPGSAGAGYFVVNKNKEIIFQRCVNLGQRTNNQAQYLAFIMCVLDCKLNKIQKLRVFGDSQLVQRGISGAYKIQEKKLKYLNILGIHISKLFKQFQIIHIPREKNTEADKLSNLALKKKYLGTKKFQYL